MKNFNRNRWKTGLGALILLLVVVKAQSQTLGNWTLNNSLAGSGSSHSVVHNVALGSSIGSGSFNGGVEYFGENGWPTGAINMGAYIQFSIGPSSGHEIHLSGVTIRIRRSNTGSPAGSGPTSWSLRSSRDGYSSDLGAGSMTHNYSNFTIPLTSFTALTTTTTFRLYGYNASISTGGNNRFVIDNISIQGITALLPVQFKYVNAQSTESGNQILAGLTQIEAGTKITLEKSVDGVNFHSILSQIERSNRAEATYTFVDRGGSEAYYRVLALDNNGLVKISKIVFIDNKISNRSELKVRMSVGSEVISSIKVEEGGNYDFRVLTTEGKLILHKKYSLAEGNSVINLNIPSLNSGVYVLQVFNKNTFLNTRFVKTN